MHACAGTIPKDVDFIYDALVSRQTHARLIIYHKSLGGICSGCLCARTVRSQAVIDNSVLCWDKL